MFIIINFSILILSMPFNLVCCNIYATLSITPEDPAIYVTDKNFFSVALDTSVVADHFKDFNMKNRRLNKLIKDLSPGYLRIGGNMADRLHFDNNSKTIQSYNFNYGPFLEECSYEELTNCHHNIQNFTMSGEEWKNLNNFAKNIRARILFDLNCLIRNEDGSWNSENAEELIAFSNDHNFNIDWQLGNEPNAFKHLFNYPVNASQLAKDFTVLRNILNKFPQYRNSILVGPDITRPRPEHQASEKYLRQFLRTIKKENVLNAVSFHQYYLNGRIATKSDFLNSTTFELLEQQINIVNNIVEKSNFNKLPVWLTETSSAFGGGAPGLSNRFVGSFLWLDKLGLSAKLGVKVVVRQSIKRNSYALINDQYNPNPDWWLSVLYNKLVGPEVLNCNKTGPNTIRLYCQCSASFQIPTITVFGINISNSTAFIKFEGIQRIYLESFEYILTADKQNLLTNKVVLNGKLLELSEDAEMPAFRPRSAVVSKPLMMPAYSLAFWTVPSLNAKSCSRPNIIIN